ncbi:hypothetical protein IVB46_11590 [Bradyrhizobium sp. 61]|uniref:hypothetical protein n=1 Tax=unclassified Bradyrhizobium TaxID=2631580 RepID=UPI001FF8EBB7|nr:MULTISPECIES: hypothetical protein [unclassified Bradyrhizobium]MCK1275874.1 hypothetical protein [Bradyrhizobium sp. 61]MCK1443110.1 hypothetical protein [Bradyrhizobium sp. 48]MCK1460578.1 hypothetical protein [Bradyrhizobium sp. 2]
MAPLPKTFDCYAVEARGALAEGRTQDAITIVVERLRTGTASAELQALAARLLRPPKKGRGKPKSDPSHWFEIGTEFEDQMSRMGLSYEEAAAALAKKFGYSERQIGVAVRYFRDRMSDAE